MVDIVEGRDIRIEAPGIGQEDSTPDGRQVCMISLAFESGGI
jgi:hypothetical protein